MKNIEQNKIKIGIIFGGRSCEHEISILSAASVMDAIDKDRYEIVPIGITKEGKWFLIKANMSGITSLADERIKDIFTDADPITIADFDEMTDFAFPLLHGPYGEDGTIQGLFKMLGKPYAGCGVAASAISMDKIFTKEMWLRAGLPVCKHRYTTTIECKSSIEKEIENIESALTYPVFVKPANMGSSVGVSKVENRDELREAILNALHYDDRILAEENVSAREFEVALLGNGDADVSVVGEIINDAEYYDYDSKYKNGETELIIPAKLPPELSEEIEKLAKKAYKVLDGEGFSRIDLFFDEKNGKVYLNEMNTIPGFTKFSMFPLLWESKGCEYSKLIERIIALGYERHNAENNW